MNNTGTKHSGELRAPSEQEEQFYPELHRFLINRLRGGEDAQDIAQEAYLRLLRVKRTELIRQPRAYLYRIAVNLVSEFRLREQRDLITFNSDTALDAAEHPIDAGSEDESQRAAAAQQIEILLEQLPPLYRAIFVLRKRDGLSYVQIAAELNISVHTVKKYLARSLAMCRRATAAQ